MKKANLSKHELIPKLIISIQPNEKKPFKNETEIISHGRKGIGIKAGCEIVCASS